MSTRTCKHCGWVYPHSFVGTKCTICGTDFDERFCPVCKQLLPLSAFSKTRATCHKCRRPYENAFREKRLGAMDIKFEEWLAKVKKVPKNYPTLTEAQWLEACKHFDGCARCSSNDVDSRGFFIDASLGGRYCDWNIIPLCERCANTWNLTKSVFRYTEKRDYNNRSHEYRESLAGIIEYLGGKLDNAIGHL